MSETQIGKISRLVAELHLNKRERDMRLEERENLHRLMLAARVRHAFMMGQLDAYQHVGTLSPAMGNILKSRVSTLMGEVET